MKNRIRKSAIALLLVFSMLVLQLPIGANAAEEAPQNTQTQAISAEATQETSALPVVDSLRVAEGCSILKYVDAEVFRKGDHIARLSAEETLSSYAFLNSDGSKTVYYMDDEVKFVDANGKVQEKDLTLTSTVGGYTTASNDVRLTLPTNPSSGIGLTYGNYHVSLIPQGGTLSKPLVLENNTVTYPDYFGQGMDLVYTPTMSGVKEDIVLSSYTGVNSFTFMLNTRGLNLYQANGRYFLSPAKGSDLRIDLGDIVSFDAKGRFSIGTVTAATVSAGNLYRLTVTVDEEFLTDENTAYPVSIDPTITVSDSTHGAGAIQDATIYQGSPNLNTGSWTYLHCGYYDSTYKVARTAYRLPGVLNDNSVGSVSAYDISSATFYIREAGWTAGVPVNLHLITSDWTESSITWNSHSSRYNSYVEASASPSYGNYAGYDITNIVRDWLTADLDEYGFMLVSTNETSVDKTFYSSEYGTADNRPYVAVTYNAGEMYLSDTSISVDVGSTKTLSVTGAPSTVTWNSSDSSVASVNSSGVVTGLKAGTVTILASVSGYNPLFCTVYVTIPDGVYRISSKSAGLPIGTEGNILNGTNVSTRAYSSANPTQLYQLWRITHLSYDVYSIRPLYKLDRALHVNGTNVDILNIGNTDNLSSVSASARWSITATSNGYAIMKDGLSQQTLTVASTGTSAGINVSVASYSSSSAQFHWELSRITNPPSGVLLFDATTGVSVSNPTRYVALNEARALSNMNLEVSVYSGNISTSQSISWSGGNEYVHLDTSSGSLQGTAVGTAEITGTSNYGSFSFLVEVLPFSNGTYFIRSWNSDKHVDIKDQALVSGTTIHQWEFHGGNTQRWVFTHLGDATYSIHSANSTTRYYLGVSGDSTANDQPIVLKTGEITPGMKWKISTATSGASILTPLTGVADPNSDNAVDRVLTLDTDILGNATANGMILQQSNFTELVDRTDEWLLCPVNSVPILEGQTTNVWCWVTAARMASSIYMKSLVSQTSAAVRVKLNVRDLTPLETDVPLAIQTGTPYETGEALSYILGAENVYTALWRIYSEDTLRSLLDAGNVVICHRGYYVNGSRPSGHAVVIYDYHWNSSAGVYMYDILDPSPMNSGSQYAQSYASFCNGQNALPGFEQPDSYIWESVITFEIGAYQNTIAWPGT